MILWHKIIHISRPLASMPQPAGAASERQTSTAYQNPGISRTEEDQCVFKYTLSGRGEISDSVGKHSVPLHHGFVCRVADPDINYYYPDDATEPWDFVYLCFAGQAAVTMVRELVERCGRVFSIPPECGFMQRIMAFGDFDGDFAEMTPAEGADLVMSLLTGLVALQQADQPADPQHTLVRRAQEFVARNRYANINVTELADAMSVSREHLSRVFTEQTGITPYRYIVRQKMLLACRLLKETTLSSKEIAGKLGYDAPAQFTRTFKNTLHTTPTHFRQTGTTPFI